MATAAAAAAAMLAFAGAAPARMEASQPAAVLAISSRDTAPAHRSTTLVAALFATEATPAQQVVIYIPQGYVLDLSSAPGATVGRALVLLSRTYSLGEVPQGKLESDDPAKYSADPDAQACAPGAHAAVWTASLSYGFDRAKLAVAFFVDPTSGAEAARGAYKVVACLPSPEALEVPAGTFLALAFELQRALTNPSSPGVQTWHLLVTPYVAEGGVGDPQNTVEARAHVPLPQSLTVTAVYNTKTKKLGISGRLTAVDAPRAGALVDLTSAASRGGDSEYIGTATTHADGSFSYRHRFSQTRRPQKLYLLADVFIQTEACTDAPLLASACVSQSISPPPPRSFAATIPQLKPRKKR